MGRGRPLPPPGMPLPPPERPKTNSFLVPKRKAVPPPLLPKRPDAKGPNEFPSAKSSPKPPLPDRRKRQSPSQPVDEEENEVLVVEAPTESAPTSPAPDEHHDDFFGHGEPTLGVEEKLEPTSLTDRDSHVEEPVESTQPWMEEPVKPPLPARGNDNEQPTREEVAQVHTRPPSPERKSSEMSPSLPHEGDELKRQELGMYT